MYHYQNLKDVTIVQLAACFNLAFSDYALPMHLSEEQLQARFAASGVDWELSFGAFWEGELVGFIINSCGRYMGRKVVFDVATGVVPAHRGKGVFKSLFAFARGELPGHGVEAYYLETLQQNARAIGAYEKQGFAVVREFEVLKFPSGPRGECGVEVERTDLAHFAPDRVAHCTCVPPCYEHSTPVLQRNPDLYAVAWRERDGKVTAFCVIEKENGHILQLGYEELEELKMILSWLVARFENITVKNLDRAYPQVLDLFFSLGFEEVTRQFEMAKDLKG